MCSGKTSTILQSVDMLKHKIIAIAGVFLFTGVFAQDAVVTPANETWPRAILHGDYPDPTIIRDGADYYMTHSVFSYAPGFRIWHSRDLVNWEPVCRVVGSGMAPDLVKYQGKFYIYYPSARNNWVTWAGDIHGPWSKPTPLGVGHIDPGHAVGEDGKRYLFLSGGYRVGLTDDGLAITGEPETVYSGWEFPKDWKTEGNGEMFLESPKVFRKGDYYYMISAEGGTAGPATSHMCVVARSKSINGPWENSPHNPLVHTYSSDEPWWSKGHGTMIDDVNGNWWIVYHAYENGLHTLGRQTLLDPIDWTKDGWPILAKTAHPLPSARGTTNGMQLSDDFSGKELGLQWTGWRSFDPQSTTLKDNSLRLAAKGTNPADSRLLLITAADCSYEVRVEVTLDKASKGGLVLFYNDKAFVGISSDGKEFNIYKNCPETVRQSSNLGDHFYLKIVNHQNVCNLQASPDGKSWKTIESDVDVSQMNHNVLKGFLALRPGIMAAGEGIVKFEHFQYVKIQ
jgi:beta-xylosidase